MTGSTYGTLSPPSDLTKKSNRPRVFPRVRCRYFAIHSGSGAHDWGIRLYRLFLSWVYGQLGWMVPRGDGWTGVRRDCRYVSRHGRLCSLDSPLLELIS